METATPHSTLENVLLLARHLTVCPEEARPALLHLAVRAALHPSLRPYLLDPLRPLDGQFLSLDAHLAGILEYAAARRVDAAMMAGLAEEDRRILHAVSTPAPFPKRLIGALAGALFVSHSGTAIPCRVFAAYLPDCDVPSRSRSWAAPIAVRAVSEEVLLSAQSAFAAALWTIEHECDLPAPLWPAPLYFDVAAPGLAEGDLQRVSGDSLGLPLALAFLSALLTAPLRSNIAATGAVGKSPRHPAAITDVGWVREKAAALRGSTQRLLAPTAIHDTALPVTGVTSLRGAARYASSGMPALLRRERSRPRPARRICPPTGTVTFLFTEIAEAAHLWEVAPAAMRAASEAHDRLVEDAILRQGGTIFRRGSEGFCAAFAGAEDACRAALAVQRRLHAHLWPGDTGTLGVRIGVHTGTPDFYRGDYSGPSLHHTNRLMAAAHGGQILLSETVTEALQPDPAGENWQIAPLGNHRLRDLSEPMALFQLSCPPLPDDFPPPHTLEQRRHNLPVQLTSLVSRETEVAMLSGLLRSSETRLITLTGPGGVGKTRLALQATATQVDSFPDGVWFVSLVSARTATEVASAVRQTLGLKDCGDPAAAVVKALRSCRTLLVLDNFETALPPGAAFVSDLLREAPHVVCLATSRALLQVRGEQRFEVPPLAVPPDDAPLEDIRASGAVALFCDRVRESDLSWTPSDEDTRLVLSICRRLDGLPLAIELAAARVRNFPLPELATRLADAFSLLSTSLHDVTERHRTLLNTLQWSYDLLDARERRLFARLSVFEGGFDGEAAEAVGDDPDTREILESLADKSLVMRHREGETGRFTLLSLISDFARRKLEKSAEAEAARGVHADYYAALAEREGSATRGAREVSAFDILDREMENLRAAFEWLTYARPDVLPPLMNAVSEFLRRRGHWRERVQWLLPAIAAAAPDTALKRRLLFLHASALNDYGDKQASQREFRSALEMAREAHDHLLTVDVLNQLGLTLTAEGRMEEADALHHEALELSRREGYKTGLALSLSSLGYMAFYKQDYPATRLYYTEGMDLWRSLGNQRQLAIALTNLACIHDAEGEYARARPLFADCLQCFRDLKDFEGIAMSLANLGEMTERCGDIEFAVPLLLAAERLLSDLGHNYRETVAAILGRCELPYGLDRLRTLRQVFSRRSAEDLRNIEPQERWLPIRAVEKIPVPEDNPSSVPPSVSNRGE